MKNHQDVWDTLKKEMTATQLSRWARSKIKTLITAANHKDKLPLLKEAKLHLDALINEIEPPVEVVSSTDQLSKLKNGIRIPKDFIFYLNIEMPESKLPMLDVFYSDGTIRRQLKIDVPWFACEGVFPIAYKEIDLTAIGKIQAEYHHRIPANYSIWDGQADKPPLSDDKFITVIFRSLDAKEKSYDYSPVGRFTWNWNDSKTPDFDIIAYLEGEIEEIENTDDVYAFQPTKAGWSDDKSGAVSE